MRTIADRVFARRPNSYGPKTVIEGGRQKIHRQHSRVRIVMVGFVLMFGAIGVRLISLGFGASDPVPAFAQPLGSSRPDIVDRGGNVVATDLRAASLYAEPRRIQDVDEAVERLASVLPDLDYEGTYRKLKSDAAFAWIKRQLTPSQQQQIHALGVPGIGFRPELIRFYPGGSQMSHVLGFTDVDNRGLAGMEKWIDQQGLADLRESGLADARSLAPVQLSLDARIQHVMHDELSKAMDRYRATAAGGVVLNVKSGEVLSLVSLPDFDPNSPANALEKDRLNRMSAGTSEMGSTIKTFTTAMALEVGGATLTSMFDASRPLAVGRQLVRDPRGKARPLSLQEVFLFSSNIGSAQEALMVGVDEHRAFLERAGLLTRLETELPEVAQPYSPKQWGQPTSITAAFGHGFATTPLQTAVGIAGILNGGLLIPPTFLKRTEQDAISLARRIVSQETSQAMRYLYRLNAIQGSGRRANIDGYRVGGKTGTAEKVIDGRYSKNNNFNVFAAALPMDDPQFILLVVIDDPRPESPGMGITAATTSAPTAGDIIKRVAGLLGIVPDFRPVDERPTASVHMP